MIGLKSTWGIWKKSIMLDDTTTNYGCTNSWNEVRNRWAHSLIEDYDGFSMIKAPMKKEWVVRVYANSTLSIKTSMVLNLQVWENLARVWRISDIGYVGDKHLENYPRSWIEYRCTIPMQEDKVNTDELKVKTNRRWIRQWWRVKKSI